MEKKTKQITASKAIATSSTKSAKKEFDRLHDKMKKGDEKPKFNDVTAMRQLLLANPEILPFGWTIHDSLRTQIIEEGGSDGASKALILAEVDRWLRELGYDYAPPLERIHMDTIATSRLRLLFAEFRLNAAQKSENADIVEHYDQMVSSAQTRLNRSIESLARVRRLATQAPVFQVNLATNGGQQVNLTQGDLPNEKPISRCKKPHDLESL